MPFGARNEEGWRLCHRKGRTVKHLYQGRYPIVFSSQAKAKACADELNALFWKSYWKTESKDQAPENDVFWGMLWIIEKHGGVASSVVKEIEDNAS